MLTGVSPDGKFGVLSDDSTGSARLVALPSRQTVVETLIDSQGEAPSVLWSEDSHQLFCWIQQARTTTYEAYRLAGGLCAKLSLPDYELPIERKLRHKSQGHGEETLAGVRWLDGGDLVVSQGASSGWPGKPRGRG